MKMTMKEFLSNCTACGGNWTAMVASGVRKLWPSEFEALPSEFNFNQVMNIVREHVDVEGKMKDKVVIFNLYGMSFKSRPTTYEAAQEMVRQLGGRSIKDAVISPALPQAMYVIVGVDRGDGHHRLDTAGMQVWPDPEVAREEMSRWMFSTGYAVLPVEVCTEPRSLGTEEQRVAWDARRKA